MLNLSRSVSLTSVGCLCLVFSSFVGHAQDRKVGGPAHDSSYYKTYPRFFTARAYASQKYTRLNMDAPGTPPLKFVPNNPFAVGVGLTYGIATLNLGFGLPLQDEVRRGKTRFLDLQSHVYARRWVVDGYGQFYKGYYLTPQGKASQFDNTYYIRPDMKVTLIGVSAYHLFNSERFSYRAAFLQNEWQKKSAGSFLLGGEAYYGAIRSDSTLGPAALGTAFSGIKKATFFEIGPGAGYAYTFVLQEHWFLTASGTINGDLSFAREYGEDRELRKNVEISPNVTLRAVAGYNSDKWIATASWVENNINAKGASDREYLVRTGNIRLTVARRFRASRKVRKQLNVIEAPPEKIVNTENR